MEKYGICFFGEHRHRKPFRCSHFFSGAFRFKKKSPQKTSQTQKCNRYKTDQNKYFRYPLVICYIAIENDPVEIVDLPIDSMVDLSSSFCKRLPGRVTASKED